MPEAGSQDSGGQWARAATIFALLARYPAVRPPPTARTRRGYAGGMRRWLTLARRRWGRLPRWARWVLAGYVIGFADGTGDHIGWMAHGGIHAYAVFGSVPVQAFLVSLIVLDPVAAVLCLLSRRAGPG